MKYTISKLYLTLLSLFMCDIANAQVVPSLMNYQGRLSDASGKPLEPTDSTLAFSIYGVEKGGDPIWGPQMFSGVPLVDGYFNVQLGPVDVGGRPLSGAFNGSSRYIELTIGNGTPILPRQQVLSTPYAFKAGSVVDSGITAAQIANGQVNDRHLGIVSHLSAGDGDPVRAVDVDNNGYVSIGTGAQPAGLSVVGVTQLTGDQSAIQHLSSAGDPRFLTGLRNDLARPQDFVFHSYAGNWVFRGGNVGIDNTTPSLKLDIAGGDIGVSGSRRFVARYENGSTDYSSSLSWNALQLGNNGGNYIIAGRTLHGGSLVFVTGNTIDFQQGLTKHNGREVMVLLPDGRVGIGTDKPGSSLELSNKENGRHSRLDIFKSSGLDSDRASLRVGYDADNNLEIFRTRAEGHINYRSSQPGADQRFSVVSGAKFQFQGGDVKVTDGDVYARNTKLTSDRASKERITGIDPKGILDSLAKLPISRWNYKDDRKQAPHLGPIAQDFKKAFGLGDDDRHISAVDAQGVALASIQGLHSIVKDQQSEIQSRDAKIEALYERVARLEKLLETLLPKGDLR